MNFDHLIPHFRLSQPLEHVVITQQFAENKTPFYKEMGLSGHTGTDLWATNGTPFFAVIDGICLRSGTDSQQGRYVIIESEVKVIEGKKYKIQILYYHIERWEVLSGEKVYRGQRLGTTDNTGRFTTGSHLHFSLTPLWMDDKIWHKDFNNGYRGAIDSQPFFTHMAEAFNPYGLPQDTLVQLTEGVGGFALFARDIDGNDRFFMDQNAVDKVLASWLVRGIKTVKIGGEELVVLKSKPIAVAQIVWDAYKPIWRNLKNEPIT